MTIRFTCTCGKSLKAPNESEGHRAQCPKCAAVIIIPLLPPSESSENPYELKEPTPAPAPPPRVKLAPRAQAQPQPAFQTPVLIARPSFLQRYGYLLLLLALIPLVLSAFKPNNGIEEQIEHTLKSHPEVPNLDERISNLVSEDGELKVSKQEFFAAFPNDRLDGALFSQQTWNHWLLALASAVIYFIFLAICFPGASRFIKGLLSAGIFTSTIGILILLFFQWAAVYAPLTLRGGGLIALILLIVKFIGLSYALADNPDVGFLFSFIGFTCGVGFCEEVTKIIPILFRIKPTPGEEDPSWQSLLLWGLASGVGFGIAEGIMYSSRYYNGVSGADIYAVRFLSCVVLHAMWAGANGISAYRRQADLEGADNHWEYAFHILKIVWIPMVLHGLYDTLLKKEHDILALLVAAASFAWLAWQIERAHKEEPALSKI